MLHPNRRGVLLLGLLGFSRPARADPLSPAALMARLASVADRRANFREERRFAALTETLVSTGRLLYRRPDYLEKDTLWPTPERMVIDGNRLVITGAGTEPPRVIDLSGQPELRAMTEAMRGPLAGDLPALLQRFSVAASGMLDDWTLDLAPRDAAAAKLLRRIHLAGRDTWIAAIDIEQANGDRTAMRIDPA